MHLVMGCISSLLIWVVWFIHMRTRQREEGILPGYRLPIDSCYRCGDGALGWLSQRSEWAWIGVMKQSRDNAPIGLSVSSWEALDTRKEIFAEVRRQKGSKH
jgi:hypothetical protein